MTTILPEAVNVPSPLLLPQRVCTSRKASAALVPVCHALLVAFVLFLPLVC